MNKSMLIGGVLGAAVAIAGGGICRIQDARGPEYAEVVARGAGNQRIETPREECHRSR
ncbi:MAG: hypothetical protein IPF57_03825 [Gammaproteobacteria bacterium]|nr:hypothetical protein [Gammaproteobacteria bacterium]